MRPSGLASYDVVANVMAQRSARTWCAWASRTLRSSPSSLGRAGRCRSALIQSLCGKTVSCSVAPTGGRSALWQVSLVAHGARSGEDADDQVDCTFRGMGRGTLGVRYCHCACRPVCARASHHAGTLRSACGSAESQRSWQLRRGSGEVREILAKGNKKPDDVYAAHSCDGLRAQEERSRHADPGRRGDARFGLRGAAQTALQKALTPPTTSRRISEGIEHGTELIRRRLR